VVATRVAAVGEDAAAVAVVVTGTTAVIRVDMVEIIKEVGEVMDLGRTRIKVKVCRHVFLFFLELNLALTIGLFFLQRGEKEKKDGQGSSTRKKD